MNDSHQSRGGSLKRDMYSNHGIQSSSTKNSKKVQPSSISKASRQEKVPPRKSASQDTRDKYGNIVQYGNYLVDEDEDPDYRYKKAMTQNVAAS